MSFPPITEIDGFRNIKARLLSLPLALLLLGLSACEGAGGRGASEAAARAPSAVARADGLCEHGVLEVICPKCRPSVAAVFQAKGDWCEEHGFPESICPTCHPERGGRPAVDVEGDEPPADGTLVRFGTKDTARLAGIETVKATTGERGPKAEAFVRIQYDATRLALVSAPAAGVLRRIAADVGTRVKRGEVLAVVESATVGADRSGLIAAEARLRAAEANLRREQELREKGVSPAKDVEAAESERDAARAAVQAARAALGVVGAGATGAGGYSLTSPLDGVVTRRMGSIGQSVSASDVLFEVVDPSSMWADVEVPEQDLAHVRAGQEVSLRIDTLEDHTFRSVIDFLSPAIDPRTRTALARVKLENESGLLRANMFGRAFIALETARDSVVVPTSALQYARGQAFVFVKKAIDLYEARRVKVGLSDEELVEIREGVAAGEEVATTGAFLLKTEILKGAIGAGCCE